MGIEKRPGSRGRISYQARIRSAGKKYRSRAFPSRELAERELGLMRVAQRRGMLDEEYGSGARARMLRLADVIPQYLDAVIAENAPRTVARKQAILRRFALEYGDRRVADISSVDIERYKRRRVKEVSGPTVNRELATLSHVMSWAERQGARSGNPVRGVKRYAENLDAWRYLSPDEIDALLDACGQELKRAPHLLPMVVAALNTGLRKGELLGLLWDDVDLRAGVLNVRRNKTRSRSQIPLLPQVLEALRRLPHHGPFVFSKPDGSHFGNVQRSFETAVRRAGIGKCRWHDLRHTFASRLVESGADLFAVQELMGHTTLTMTRRYAHLSPRHKRVAIERMDAYFGDKTATFPATRRRNSRQGENW